MEELLQESNVQNLIVSDEFVKNYSRFNSCASATIETANDIQYFSNPVVTLLMVIQIIYTLLILVFGVSLNGLVVFLICKSKELKTLSFLVALQVCVVDICMSFIYGFLVIANEIAKQSVFSANICASFGFVFGDLYFFRDFLYFIFSIDRFLSVFYPLLNGKRKAKTITTMCVVGLFACILLHLIYVPGLLDCYGLFDVVKICVFVPTCSNVCRVSGYILIFIGSIGSVAPVFLYLGMFIKGRKIHHKHLRNVSQNKSFISKKDWKASKTLGFIFLALFVIIKPPFILYMILPFIKNMASYVVLKITFNIPIICVITDPLIVLRSPAAIKCFKKTINVHINAAHSYHTEEKQIRDKN